jgi:hypothetical protein
VAGFLPAYMADAYRESTSWLVNQLASLAGDDLLLVDTRVKADSYDVSPTGPSQAAFDADGNSVYARITREDLGKLNAESLEAFLASARQTLPAAAGELPVWKYTWDLILANPEQLVNDFAAAGRNGLKGAVEEPLAIRGRRTDVFVGAGARRHPLVVIDAEHGPVYTDEGAEIHPFTRIEGPCYIGKKSTLLGAKCREGNSIGPMCRVGGEVEESIIQGFSNKYHDGFLGSSAASPQRPEPGALPH